MLTLLAQLDPGSVEAWLKSFFWLAAGLASVLGCAVAVKNLRRGNLPQPLAVAKHAKYVSDEELTQVHGRIKRERDEIEKQLEALRAEDRRLREKLDGEISDLQDRIDHVPGRVIELLRQTKGLIG